MTRVSFSARISSGLAVKPFDVSEDRTEHIRDDLLAAVVNASIRHPLGLVPLDVGLHRREHRIDVAAGERVIDAAYELDVCLTHSSSDRAVTPASILRARIDPVNRRGVGSSPARTSRSIGRRFRFPGRDSHRRIGAGAVATREKQASAPSSRAAEVTCRAHDRSSRLAQAALGGLIWMRRARVRMQSPSSAISLERLVESLMPVRLTAAAALDARLARAVTIDLHGRWS
jgi:hypothetical protein